MQIKVKPPIEANRNQFILRTTVGKIKKGSYPASGKLTGNLSNIGPTLGQHRFGPLGSRLGPLLYKPLRFG